MRATVGFLVVAVCAGCSSVTAPLDDREWEELLRAKARWNAAAVSNYTLEQRQLCFCPPQIVEWARVTVRDGIVVSAVLIDAGAQTTTGGRRTVPQLFEILENNRRNRDLQEIEVEFDAQYGYPTLIQLTSKPNVADGGLTVQTRNLAVTP